MEYINYNANPYFNYTEDCAIRAISKCENMGINTTINYLKIVSQRLKEYFLIIKLLGFI